MDTFPPLHLDIVSDTVCPWCWIGKRRLDAALARIGDELAFERRWRPFELNPGMPRGGIPRREYRTAKFGSWERSLVLDAQVKDAGADDGLDFRHALQERTPSTLASHALLDLAARRECQDGVVEALFGAYFTRGRDIGDVATLVELGTAHGLDAVDVERAVTDESLLGTLHAEARERARGGVNGVPSVLLNGFLLFSGAQSAESAEAVLREAAVHEDVVAAGLVRAAASGTASDGAP